MAKSFPYYGLDSTIDSLTSQVTIRQYRQEEDGGAKSVTAELVLDPRELPGSTKPWMDGYGAAKFVMDRTSQVPAASSDKLAAMQEYWDLAMSGQLQKPREGGAGPTVSPFVEALAEIKGVSVADIQRSLRKYTAEQRASIEANPTVSAAIEKVKARRAAASEEGISLDDLA
jgi:hypothetical protein